MIRILTKSMVLGLVFFLTQISVFGQWAPEIQEISYQTSLDSSMQPSLFYNPGGSNAKPLLVSLHTWSRSYNNGDNVEHGNWCIDSGWVFAHPNFRGRNRKPETCGSDLVIQDIVDIVEYAKANANVDTNRIYCIGYSGGGMVSFLMASRASHIWAGVAAGVGIYDITDWYGSANSYYKDDIESIMGGNPKTNTSAAKESLKRSPKAYLSEPQVKDVNIEIQVGIKDGTVLPYHSMWAFNAIAKDEDTLTAEEINYFVNNKRTPSWLLDEIPDDVEPEFSWGDSVLFRRQSGKVRITVWGGAHTIKSGPALRWLSKQTKASIGIYEGKVANYSNPNNQVNGFPRYNGNSGSRIYNLQGRYYGMVDRMRSRGSGVYFSVLESKGVVAQKVRLLK